MREEDSNWFSKWEEELPPPEELMPLSQTLITPDLALAFDIRSPTNFHQPQQGQLQNQQNGSAPPPIQPNSAELESSSAELGSGGGVGGGGGGGGEEPARTLKRPRLVWTPQLHKRFVDAVAHLGIKNAVPKTIMQLMSVDGLTRENVASHLQKYRLYLKRMQSLNNGGGASAGGGLASSGDPATDHLFASSPIPPHFLHQAGGRSNSEPFAPYMAGVHHQQMAAAAAVGGHMQPQYHHHHRQIGHFGSPPSGQFEHPFLPRQVQMGPGISGGIPQNGGFLDDVESAAAANGREVLTLFPTGDN
ncbi:hypothetical protein Nepgr_020513 [Nepenthes gracilis]|uniref:HTH myb-type domain-containing protein n=1 Tax=Nepenthes gracilis TaxID=150966 RepID=A0AAD3XV49_NEPGR|nr:hypothetical protein Nepgr_020513 [Nepenthes gracilis]